MIDFISLNKEEFEKLCKRLLISENPKIKTIDGAGGDEGVDSFEGKFNGEIKIWQFKFSFSNSKGPNENEINV